MKALTVLDEVRIGTPCQANWDAMPGDDRVRSCPLCSRLVYNVEAMTSDEATALIAGREGRLCARLFRRPDGTVVTADCPTVASESQPQPWRKARLRRLHALMVVLIALLLTWAGLNAGEPHPSGTGVTWDDWVHWASVSLGLQPAPSSAPVFSGMHTMGDVY